MNKQLVDRLRDRGWDNWTPAALQPLLLEAAAEIERLHAENVRLTMKLLTAKL